MKKKKLLSLEEIEREFEERFSPDWWKGFGTTEDIDRLGIEGVKSFYRAKIKELLEGLRKIQKMDYLKWKLRVDLTDEKEDRVTPSEILIKEYTNKARGWNKCREYIYQKLDAILKEEK